MPAPLARVIDELRSSNFGVSQTEVVLSSNPDISYLALKGGYTGAFIGHLTRAFAGGVVLEALRQCAGRDVGPGYVRAVCRRLAAEAVA